MRKKLIIYDLDGTLVDTAEDICRGANHMLAELGHKPISHAEISSYVGAGQYHLVGSCLKSRDSKLIEKGAKIYRTYYEAHMMDHSHLYEGASEMLAHFGNAHQVVITNKPNPFSQQILERLGIANYFEKIIAAGDNGFVKKPDPSAIFELQQEWKIESSEVLSIGDSLIDIEMAQKAGVDIAVLLHGFGLEKDLRGARTVFVAQNFSELLNFIQKKGW